METKNNSLPAKQIRRAFIKKLNITLAAIFFLPAFSKLFAKNWIAVDSGGKKSNSQAGNGNDSVTGGFSDTPFVAEINIVGFNFDPRGWALCNGQLLPIQQNTALFSLIGTYYGGNGTSNFALPNFQGRFPMGWGNGPGLSPHNLGQAGGSENVTLITTEIPSHSHTLRCNDGVGDSSNPSLRYFARDPSGTAHYGTSTGSNNSSVTGGSFPHNNLHPYLCCNFVIALQGIYPSRG